MGGGIAGNDAFMNEIIIANIQGQVHLGIIEDYVRHRMVHDVQTAATKKDLVVGSVTCAVGQLRTR